MRERPRIGWLEVHSENYFADGGAQLEHLAKARALYPLSLHGVGLSLGSTDPLNLVHLRKLKRLVQWSEPAFVSEHLSWGSVDGTFLNDLLPLPYTEEALAHMIRESRKYRTSWVDRSSLKTFPAICNSVRRSCSNGLFLRYWRRSLAAAYWWT